MLDVSGRGEGLDGVTRTPSNRTMNEVLHQPRINQPQPRILQHTPGSLPIPHISLQLVEFLGNQAAIQSRRTQLHILPVKWDCRASHISTRTSPISRLSGAMVCHGSRTVNKYTNKVNCSFQFKSIALPGLLFPVVKLTVWSLVEQPAVLSEAAHIRLRSNETADYAPSYPGFAGLGTVAQSWKLPARYHESGITRCLKPMQNNRRDVDSLLRPETEQRISGSVRRWELPLRARRPEL